MSVVDSSILPNELVMTTLPLIGLSGLDIQKNPAHKSIWDSFNNNRKSDREAIQFKLLPFNYEFPISKPKRQSFEWYSPKGILKRNWMLKHLHVLPAVVVLFQDIEWNDQKWTEKQLQCASIVQTLKNSLQGRNTKIVIVLLQKGTPLPAGEDLLASERAANLTSVCDINAKMLFVLPQNDHLMGHILRLESAFLELAQSYYTQMLNQIRSNLKQLNQNHQTLKIRHEFKFGFISELKLDFINALKHYKAAYANLDEIRIIDTNCLEIKTIAGFINYKICKLSFKLKLPRESIQYFKTHVDKYKSRTGFKELLFEHYAWLSVQFSSFAELFCDAIKSGLPALQTQHPGIYYHKAAEYIGKRKEAFLQCCALSLSPTETSPALSSALYSEFFGSRGAKTGEPVSEQQIITLVQENEKLFNHSACIITLLGQAMAQYKVYKCLRFRKKLAIDMAEEYLKCGDHSRALTLYSLMLSDYRVDKWFSIFTEVLLKTLRSAYLSASINDFVSCSVEALSRNIQMETKERIDILENLWKVFQNVPPGSQSQIAPELKSSWETQLQKLNSPIKIDLDKLNDLLDCKITFDKRQIKYDEKIQLNLYIRSTTEVPLKLRHFAVILTDMKSNVKLSASHYSEYKPEAADESLKEIEEFLLESEKCYKIVFSGENYQFMENVDVQILRLDIQMGSERNYAILSQRTKLNEVKIFKNYNPHQDCMENINIISSCYIIPTFHLSAQTKQNNQPMLTNEFYKITTKIYNSADSCLQNVGVSISVPPNLRNKVFLTTDLMHPIQKINTNIQIDIGELQVQSVSSISYYATSLVEGNIELKQKLYYQTENLSTIKSQSNAINIDSPTTPEELPKLADKGSQKYMNSHNVKIEYIEDQVKKIKEDTIIVPCIEEIRVVARFYTLSRQTLLRAYKCENFLLRVNLNIKAPCEIDILETCFISDHNISENPYKGQQKILGSNLKQNTKFEELKLLNCTRSMSEWITQVDYLKCDNRLIFSKNSNTISKLENKVTAKNEENFNRSLLSKLPTNATIIGSTSNNLTNLNLSLSSSMTTSTGSNDDLKIKTLTDNKIEDFNLEKNAPIMKNVYNNTIDCVQTTNGAKTGFLDAIVNTEKEDFQQSMFPAFGVYCIKWRRSNLNVVNESKFIISGIDVIDPPLNIYCSIEQKMYVRVPMLLKITFKNPTKKILHLQAILNNSDSFMFSGHKQLNISIFSFSTYNLIFNLYPLKAGWQPLPELHLEYINHNISQSDNNTQCDKQENPDDQQKLELINLVKRWMPKMVFIHPPARN